MTADAPPPPAPPSSPELASAAGPPAPRSRFDRALDVVERVGNRMADPITYFVVFACAVLVASWICARTGVSVVHPGTGETVPAVDLLSRAGIRRILTDAVKNFSAFPPLGAVLVTMLGVGVAEHSGLFSVGLRALVGAVPAWALTATIVFAGVNASAAADAGVVVLPPLGALLFYAAGRHPLAGLAAAFAGVGGGFSANLLITSLDPLLAGLTEPAAKLLDPTYTVEPTANYYFMFVSTFMLTAVGTLVSERFVEPRMGRYRREGDAAAAPPVETPRLLVLAERRGLVAAGLTFAAAAAGGVLLVAPAGALLRGPDGGLKPFYEALVPLVALAFFLPGLAYGVVAGTIRSDKTLAKMLGDTMATMGGYIVLAFVAAQFVAYFAWSNLGLILAVNGAGMLKSLGLTGPPLIIALVIVSATIDLLIASASAKWAVMATVFVPMFMLLGYSPELVQASYRVGDSVSNVITPMLPYFPLLIAFARKWDPKAGLGTLISAMLPYSIAFFFAWTALLIVWMLLDLPLGPGAPIHWTPPTTAVSGPS